MNTGEAVLSDTSEAEFAEFEGHLSLIFARARSVWKESAAQVHPDLQPSGYKLLAFIGHVGSANAHEIADRFEMDKSAVSRQVRMLEELGLLESRPGAQDARLRVLTATPDAMSSLAKLRADNAARLRDALTELTHDEIRAASKAFRLLSEM